MRVIKDSISKLEDKSQIISQKTAKNGEMEKSGKTAKMCDQSNTGPGVFLRRMIGSSQNI